MADLVRHPRRPVGIRIVMIALSVASGAVAASCSTHRSADDQRVPGTPYASRRMPDGNLWMTENLKASTDRSYCYDDAEVNCHRYGRLYTWESAKRGCQSLGEGWRLPTDEEWRRLAKQFGGAYGDSDDGGKGAYSALLIGGRSGFDALLGGGRAPDARTYSRLEAHGFYWTATESDSANAWFYNFGRGGLTLYRQRDGEKPRAFSVRCMRDSG